MHPITVIFLIVLCIVPLVIWLFISGGTHHHDSERERERVAMNNDRFVEVIEHASKTNSNRIIAQR